MCVYVNPHLVGHSMSHVLVTIWSFWEIHVVHFHTNSRINFCIWGNFWAQLRRVNKFSYTGSSGITANLSPWLWWNLCWLSSAEFSSLHTNSSRSVQKLTRIPNIVNSAFSQMYENGSFAIVFRRVVLKQNIRFVLDQCVYRVCVTHLIGICATLLLFLRYSPVHTLATLTLSQCPLFYSVRPTYSDFSP